MVYVPIAAAPVTSTVMVRHRLAPEAAAELLRTEAQAVDPNVALYRMRTLTQAVREGQWNRHMSAVLADTVTWMSVLLAMVGLYAVTAQRVTLKTREIGLRMALGARPAQVARAIVAGLRVPLLPAAARHGGLDGVGRGVHDWRRRRLRQRAADAAEDRRLHRCLRRSVVRDPIAPGHRRQSRSRRCGNKSGGWRSRTGLAGGRAERDAVDFGR